MRPPLPVGSVLQNRYRILNILGQGGFGRTYLGEDQGRFNERCALKELTPAQGGEYALDKSKELFQREAQILYQIQHPQIPEFRATFEQDQRLFLVQDYVEGQTYRQLLDQRKAQGIAFSEMEVLQLMRQLLPVLAHIHSKGIIHRDIAPDNIILRQQDSKPVLIDFGVVKELATRFQTMTTGITQATTVGKPGYAPNEQMQTGKAYPSSDLYSLAVTAVVLMTGHEPQDLFDDTTMTWYWQRWAAVSLGFAQVINRMLSYRPDDRYQSVSEVVQALQSANNPAAMSPPPVQPAPVVPISPLPPTQPQQPTANQTSQMQTVAVGRRLPADQTSPSTPNRSPGPTIEEPRSSIWDDPLAIIATGIGLVILTGLASWLIMRAILNNQSPQVPIATPTLSPSPTVTPSPSPTVTSSPSPSAPEPVNYSRQLNLASNSSVTQSGVLKANETMTYIVRGGQADTLEAVISGEGVLMTLYAPDNRPINDNAKRVSYWRGALPYDGDYFIELKPVRGLDSGRYELNVSLQRQEPVPPSPSPSPDTTPQVNETPVSFPPGDTTKSFKDRIQNNVVNRYVVSAQDGSVISAQVWGGGTLRVYDPAGQVISSEGASYWQSTVSYDSGYRAGDYRIEVLGQPGTDYTLELGLVDRERG